MVAEVCLGKVGAVCAREVSRFARNSRDWHQLLEICAMFDTLIGDADGVYEHTG
jgi:DNA invertase Pin-like site-specific DNA recombinase